MNKCNNNSKYEYALLINWSDVKSFTEDGLEIKRKYGKFKRPIT